MAVERSPTTDELLKAFQDFCPTPLERIYEYGIKCRVGDNGLVCEITVEHYKVMFYTLGYFY